MSVRVDTTSWIASSVVIGNTGLGVLGSNIPPNGVMLATVVNDGLEANEIRILVTVPPVSGELFVYEDTSYEYTNPTPGSYEFTYQAYVDGAVYGSPVVVPLEIAAPGPVITSVNGGSPITNKAGFYITGTGFTGVSTVTIDNEPQLDINVTSDTQITCTAVRGNITRNAASVTLKVDAATHPVQFVSEAGFNFVDCDSIAPNGVIQAIPDLKIGDQVEWETLGGAVTVLGGMTVETTSIPQTFKATAYDGTSWGVTGTIEAGAQAPVITSQPTSTTVLEGQSATWTVSATSATGAVLSYEWFFDGAPVGGDSTSYTRTNCVLADDGKLVTVNVTDVGGTTASTPAGLVVNENYPTIISQPQPVSVISGSSASFSVTATSSGGSLHYQWYEDGSPVGTDSNSYVKNLVIPSDNGVVVTVDVTNDYQTVSSDGSAIITVSSPSLLTWPLNEGSGSVVTCIEDPIYNGTIDSGDWTTTVTNSRFYPMDEGSGDTFRCYDAFGVPTAINDATIQNYNSLNWSEH